MPATATALRQPVPGACPFQARSHAPSVRPPTVNIVRCTATGATPSRQRAPQQPRPPTTVGHAASTSVAPPPETSDDSAEAARTQHTKSANLGGVKEPGTQLQDVTTLAEWRLHADKLLRIKPNARSARQAAHLLEVFGRVTPALSCTEDDAEDVAYVRGAMLQFYRISTRKVSHQTRMLRGTRAILDAHPPLRRDAANATSDLHGALAKLTENVFRKRDVYAAKNAASQWLLADVCECLSALVARGAVGRSEFFWDQLERRQAKYPQGAGPVHDAHVPLLALAGTQARLRLGRPPADVLTVLTGALQRSGGEVTVDDAADGTGDELVTDTRWAMEPAAAFKALCWQQYLQPAGASDGDDGDAAAAARESLDALEGPAALAALVRACGRELVPLEAPFWGLLAEKIDGIVGVDALDGEAAADLAEGLALARMPASEGTMRRLVSHTASNTLRAGYPRAVAALAALHSHLWDPHRACAIMWQALTDEESSGESYAAAPADEIVWQINSTQSRTVAADVWWERFAQGALMSTGWRAAAACVGLLQPLLDDAGAAAEAYRSARGRDQPPAVDLFAAPPAQLGAHALCALLGRLALRPDAKLPEHLTVEALAAEVGRVASGVLSPPAWAGAQLGELCSALVALDVPVDTNARAAIQAAVERAEATDAASVAKLRAALPKLGIDLRQTDEANTARAEAEDFVAFGDLFPI